LDAARPENLLLNAAKLGGLQRNGAGLNPMWLAAYLFTVFTVTQLYMDPTYTGTDRNWWQDHWKQVLGYVLLFVAVLTFVIDPIGSLAMLATAGVFAIAGVVVNGIVNLAQGNKLFDNAAKAAQIGWMIGMAVAMIAGPAIAASIGADAADGAVGVEESAVAGEGASVARPDPIKINNSLNPDAPDELTGYTKHGIDSAISHNDVGVKPSAILDTIKNPTSITYDVGRQTFKFMGEQAVLVLNQSGEVVTTYPLSSLYWRIL